jgi:hypothetical protein
MSQFCNVPAEKAGARAALIILSTLPPQNLWRVARSGSGFVDPSPIPDPRGSARAMSPGWKPLDQPGPPLRFCYGRISFLLLDQSGGPNVIIEACGGRPPGAKVHKPTLNRPNCEILRTSQTP